MRSLLRWKILRVFSSMTGILPPNRRTLWRLATFHFFRLGTWRNAAKS